MLHGSEREGKRGSEHATCLEAVGCPWCSLVEKTKEALTASSCALGSTASMPSSSLSCSTSVKMSPCNRRDDACWKHRLSPVQGALCPRMHLSDECLLSGDSGPTQLLAWHCSGTGCLARSEMDEDIDNSELFFSREIPLAVSTS